MPFTPFHFGPGLLVKGLAPRHFSWTSFVAAQVVIDLESLYFMVQRAYPIHRFFHTLPGASLAGFATGVGLLSARRLLGKLGPAWAGGRDGLRPSLGAEISRAGILAGALVGGISHTILDAMMHGDLRPFAPWSDANPLLAIVGLDELHSGCVVSGLLGLGLLAMRIRGESKRQPARTTDAGSARNSEDELA